MAFLEKIGLSRKHSENLPAEIIETERPPLLAKLRKRPAKDDQRDFFVPVLYDIPLKDQVNLMDVSPYRLNSKSKATQLVYKVKGATIKVTAPREYGLATIKDYDIVIHMISHLNAEAEKWRRGERDTPPPNKYRPNAYDILTFCRRGKGGRQSQILEDALRRLSNSTIEIIQDDGENRLAAIGFTMIGGSVILSKSKTGKVQDLEITVPDWIYSAVVRKEAPSILTLHEDYFLLDLPLDRMLYRLARKAAGEDKAAYLLKTVYDRSGSTQSFKQFAYDLRKLIGEGRQILEYDFRIVKGEGGAKLEMAYAGMLRITQAVSVIPTLKTTTFDRARKYANGLDIYAAERIWREEHAVKGLEPPKNPDAAFIGWFKRYAANRQ